MRIERYFARIQSTGGTQGRLQPVVMGCGDDHPHGQFQQCPVKEGTRTVASDVTTNKIDQRLSIGMPLVELRGAEKRDGTISGALAFSCVLAKWAMRATGIHQRRRQSCALRDAIQRIADE